MKTLVKAIKEQWETCSDVEDLMSKFLNFSIGQLKYFTGRKEEMILVMAAQTLKRQGVTARSIEDPVFEDIVEAVKELEEDEVKEETERTGK